MSCAETLNTQAFIDGEVTGPDAEAIERHIEGCADCQAFCDDAAALNDAIRKRAPRYAAPAALRRRVEAMLDRESARRAPRLFRSVSRPSPGFWRGAFSGAGVTALAAGLAVFAFLPPSPSTLADQVTLAHTNAMMQGREIQVVSTDHHTVKPWFAGRLPLSPPVADFTAEGYKLVGGRLDKVGGAPAAVVVYRHGKHEIDLFVWADRGSPLPSAGLSHGYHSIFWKRQDLDFAAVSDTSTSELATFANLVRAEPE
ncbi:MAG TPA: zf-HC2 domain-containing protein [Caulobacteraceae bacterium]|nr:zf-HC2 domain-containing protein [Caulobacteraceae bacterium]